MEKTDRPVCDITVENTERFTELYAKVWRDLYRYAYYYLGNRSNAEDVVQEAAVEAYRGFGSLRNRDAFKAWIFKILIIRCKRCVSEMIVRRFIDSIDDMVLLPSAEHSDGNLETAILIKTEISKLNKKEREVLLLSVVGGYKSAEIALMLGMREGSVRSKLSRTLTKLRERLDAQERSDKFEK